VVHTVLPFSAVAFSIVLASWSEPGLPAGGDRLPAPPGLVAIEGGRTTIGSEKKDLEAMMEEMENLRAAARPFDAETPQHTRDVEDFALGINEVTNEQYRPFVEATGHRPPFEWGEGALNEARSAFLTEQGKLREEARKAGKPIPPRKEFDKEKWWNENWSSASWEIPEGHKLKPVVYVDYSDVIAYCRWAGLRLPTEFEIQRAVRGKTKQMYPWGDNWEDGKFAATNEIRRINATQKIGSYPAGTTSDGVVDLVGNVWEWTSSPYVAYPRFKPNEYRFGTGRNRQEIKPAPEWDANRRVAVLGCYQSSRWVGRCTTRRPTDRIQLTNALGFRTAATPKACVDVATTIERFDVRNSPANPGGIAFAPAQAFGMDRWDSVPGSEGAPTGYSVITNYEYMLFTPIEQLPGKVSSMTDVEKASLIEPIYLGFLSSSVALENPELAPGTYLVAFRAKGKKKVLETPEDEEEGDDAAKEDKSKKKKKGDDEDAPEEPEEELTGLEALIDIQQDNLIFFDASTGEFSKAIKPISTKLDKMKSGGSIAFKDVGTWITTDGKREKLVEKWLSVQINIPTQIRNRGLLNSLELKPADGTADRTWRR